MNCANLLAFIQVAIAFDLGLVYLNNSHILKGIHKSMLGDLKYNHRIGIERAERLIKQTDGLKNKDIRMLRLGVTEALSLMKTKLDPDSGKWGKYAYLGLFGGIYGLICLLVIGMFNMFDPSYDKVLRTFLLFTAELILAMEVLSIIQISAIEKGRTSTYKVAKKMAYLIVLLAGTYICAEYDLGYGYFVSFEKPFIWFTVIIVYLPVFVYAFMMAVCQFQIWMVSKKCNHACQRLEEVILEAEKYN